MHRSQNPTVTSGQKTVCKDATPTLPPNLNGLDNPVDLLASNDCKPGLQLQERGYAGDKQSDVYKT